MYKSSSDTRQASLFWDLETMLDPKHPLFKPLSSNNKNQETIIFCTQNVKSIQ